MSSMVQSVITWNNWTTWNAMTFIITGNWRRTADAYGSTWPKLVIEYVTQ